MTTLKQDNVSKIDYTSTNQGLSRNSQITTHYEAKYQLNWCFMHPRPRPCFNPALVEEMTRLYRNLNKNQCPEGAGSIRFQVTASAIDSVFNLGGDLEMFKNMVLAKDKSGLSKYAHICIDTMYEIATLHQKGITQIMLLQGDALGGGFEMALASDVLIAEKSSRAGFPDILFNSFPGIGAYTFLSRKIGAGMAERMITSGKIYSAEELHDMGIIDILAEDGQGEMAVYNHITRETRYGNAMQSIRKIRKLHSPLEYSTLAQVADLWVDNAMRITGRDIRMIDHLISKQNIISKNAAA